MREDVPGYEASKRSLSAVTVMSSGRGHKRGKSNIGTPVSDEWRQRIGAPGLGEVDCHSGPGFATAGPVRSLDAPAGHAQADGSRGHPEQDANPRGRQTTESHGHARGGTQANPEPVGAPGPQKAAGIALSTLERN